MAVGRGRHRQWFSDVSDNGTLSRRVALGTVTQQNVLSCLLPVPQFKPFIAAVDLSNKMTQYLVFISLLRNFFF